MFGIVIYGHNAKFRVQIHMVKMFVVVRRGQPSEAQQKLPSLAKAIFAPLTL